MNYYLSYGAGVGSEALRLWLLDQNQPFEAVYVDHGCDWPETQQFVKTVPNVKIIRPNVEGFSNLYDYCFKYHMVPSFMNRWCSDKFKVRCLIQYFKKPCIVFIGFTYDEAHRVDLSRTNGVSHVYPLIDNRITRAGAKRFTREHGGEVPMRSSCWFCPFQGRVQWQKLRREHIELYKKAKELEKRNIAYRKEKGKEPLTLSANKKSVAIMAAEGQRDLFAAP